MLYAQLFYIAMVILTAAFLYRWLRQSNEYEAEDWLILVLASLLWPFTVLPVIRIVFKGNSSKP